MDVGTWLRGLGLERYEGAFRDNAIDVDVLPRLTAEDLKEIGVAAVGDRRRLLDAIAGLNGGAAVPGAGDRAAAAPPDAAASPAAESPPPPPGPERRQLTVLFCDLVGSTALAGGLDPEDLGAVMHAYHGCATEVVRRFDGHVAKFLGDGVLAYFGYPRAHEEDAERAVRAGLDLVEAVGRLRPRDGLSLRTRVGIATGLVVVGDLIGEGAARETAVIGETPNLAARLQGLAEPGAVVIAPGTRRLVAGLFDCADLGPCRLKGFADPVRAYRVLGAGAAESRFEARLSAGLTPLVGREHELGLLLDRWQLARDGEGQVVLLAGEPGIGKSRLLRALRERLDGEGRAYTPLRYQCSPYHTHSALHPVADQLARAARFERGDGPEARLAKLEALLGRATADVAAAAPLLAELLAIPTGERYPPPDDDLTPQRRKEQLFGALLAQFEGLAAERPVLVLYEDVQWIDPTSLELLGLMVERMQRLPALAVLTVRPEFAPPRWTGYAHVTTLSLSRLGRRQGAALVAGITGNRALPPEVVEQIVAKTDGVPLFVEELTKATLESGLLVRDAGGSYELSGPLPPMAVPATLHDSLMARLDRLAPVKEVAQIGAAIGRAFSYDLLAAVAPLGEAELRDALRQLTAAELVFQRGAPPDAVYSFKHALVQDAAYQSLLKSRRQQLHARIAAALRERFPEAAEAEPEAVARHYAEAGFPDEAVGYLAKAGRRALARSANAEAAGHLGRGLALLADLPAGPERDARELDLLVALGPALIATKGFSDPEVQEVYLRARALCQGAGNVVQLVPVLVGLANTYLVRAELRQARELGDECLALTRHRDDPDVLMAALRMLGTALHFLGDFPRAREQLERAVALNDRHARRFDAALYLSDSRVHCRSILARVLWTLGYPERALATSDEALRLAAELSHGHTTAQALSLAAGFHLDRRDVGRTERLACDTVALAAEHGFPYWQATGNLWRGWALVQRGEAEAGLAQIERSLAHFRAKGDGLTIPHGLIILAEVRGRLGEPAAGLAALAEALVVLEGTGERRREAEIHRLQGELSLALPGRHCRDEAEACFDRALAVAREQGARMWELRAATSLARLRRDQGRRAEARDLLAPIYGWFTEGFDTPDLKDAEALLDELR